MPAQFAVTATKRVPIDSVVMHPKNPRRGDVTRIAESLEIHGQYKPIVVQISSNHICAGNHVWQAAKGLGWSQIQASFIDVDDDTALRILIADNQTSAVGTFDFAALGALLESLPDPTRGTGFVTKELDSFLAGLAADAEKAARGGPTDTVLRAVDVTVDDPEYMPGTGEVWKLGTDMLLVCDDVFTGMKWRTILETGYYDFFLPYPGPFVVIAKRVENKRVLLVQPDSYIAGHIIRIWEQATGGKAVQVEDGVMVPMPADV